MSYEPETILERKTKFKDDEEKAWNEIRVIGPSPVDSAVRVSEWEGQAGNLISVTPTSFGSVVDVPYGKLQEEYKVIRTPEPITYPAGQPTIRQVKPGLSPEDKFRTETAEAVKPSDRARDPEDRISELEAKLEELAEAASKA